MGWNGEPWPGRPTVLSTYLGPVRLIHHKALKHPHGLCKLVNAAASATRVVVGATACAMHDLNEIRVHEISDGSPWLAGD